MPYYAIKYNHVYWYWTKGVAYMYLFTIIYNAWILSNITLLLILFELMHTFHIKRDE